MQREATADVAIVPSIAYQREPSKTTDFWSMSILTVDNVEEKV